MTLSTIVHSQNSRCERVTFLKQVGSDGIPALTAMAGHYTLAQAIQHLEATRLRARNAQTQETQEPKSND